MTIREYLNEKIRKAERWKATNVPTDIYFAYANVQIGILKEILHDFENTKYIDAELNHRSTMNKSAPASCSPIRCTECNVCRTCGGDGKITYKSTWWDDNADRHPVTCPDCKGTGKRVNR